MARDRHDQVVRAAAAVTLVAGWIFGMNPLTPQRLGDFERAELARWAQVMKIRTRN